MTKRSAFRGLCLTNRHYWHGDVALQIKSLKAQYLQLSAVNPYMYNDETFRKCVVDLCGRIARYYNVKFKKVSDVPLVDRINQLIKDLPPVPAHLRKDVKKDLTDIKESDTVMNSFSDSDQTPVGGEESVEPRQEAQPNEEVEQTQSGSNG